MSSVIDATRHARHVWCEIRSFGNRDTELVWLCERVPRIDPRIHKAANRKLRLLDAAPSLNSLRVPPGNRLEALRAIARGGTAFGSTTSGEFVSCGLTLALRT